MKMLNRYVLGFMSALLLTASFYTDTGFAKSSQQKPEEEVTLSREESDALDNAIPSSYKKLLIDETEKNPYFYADESKIVESSVTRGERLSDVRSLERLGNYDPTKGNWFYLPHLEIPVDDIENMNVSPSISPEMKKLYFFTRGGVKYIRYFLHPIRDMDNYQAMIRKYDLKYEYLVRPISSPRSMIIIKKGHPEEPSWVKVSLPLTMSALQRRQKPEKLARALMVNEALELIPQEKRDELKLTWLNESFAVQLPDDEREEVIIGRDSRLFTEAEGSSKRWRSTFSLFHSPDGKKLPEVAGLIKKSGLSDVEFFKRHMLEPMIDRFVYLAFEEGILWSMHTGNYYTGTRADGIPDKSLAIKDFDGAAFDLEMRMLRGKPFQNIHQMTSIPFADAWFAAASARGKGKNERARLGYVYNLYIRDVYGFNSMASYMFSYLLGWTNVKSRDKARQIVEDAIDTLTAEAIKKYTGMDVSPRTLAQGQKSQSGINKVYTEWRDLNHQQFTWDDAVDSKQDLLREEFIRLAKEKRVWANFTKSDITEMRSKLSNKYVRLYYHEHAGMIQARRYNAAHDEFTTIGYAFIEDPKISNTQKEFLRKMDAKQPAKLPFDVDIKANSGKGKKGKKSKGCMDALSWLFNFGSQVLSEPAAQLQLA